MIKCKENKPCSAYLDFSSGSDSSVKGLITYRTIHVDTGKERIRLMYHLQGQGLILLNYCPWCGVPQVWKLQKGELAKKRKSGLRSAVPKKKQIVVRKKK